MAQTQPTLNPSSVPKQECFFEFEFMLRSVLAVAAFPTNQQAFFLQVHLHDAALKFFQTLPWQHVKNWNFRKQFCGIDFVILINKECMFFSSIT